MKLLGYELRKVEKQAEERSITIGPSTSVGLPYGGLSTSLSAELAMKLSAVYRCVDVLGSDIGTMPWDVLVYDGKSEWVKDEKHFSYSMLNDQPNPSCSSVTFKKALVSQMLLNGNGYARIYRKASGDPYQLELLTGQVTMYLRPDLTVYYVSKNLYTSEEAMIEGEDMIHVLNFSYDGLLGVSTLTHAGNITGLAASADGQAKGFFSSGANANGILMVRGRISGDKATDLKASFKTALEYDSTTGQSGGIAVVEDGVDFKPIQINPKDAQMLETRTFNVVDICRFFGVHPSKAFDTSGNGYGNVENYQLGYITDTMTPLAKKIDNEIARKLYRPSQRDRVRAKLRVTELLSNDLDSLSNYYSKMLPLGVYSPDDICRERNLPISKDGKGNKRYVQVNLVELGKEPVPVQNKNTNVVSDGTGN